MGSYIYRRTNEVIVAELNGGLVNINFYRYFTKPHWDLWDIYVMSMNPAPSYVTGWERQYVGNMRRSIGQQDALFIRMEDRGQISPYVVVLGDEKCAEGQEVFLEPVSSPRMCDDVWHGKAPKIGTLHRVGKKWRIATLQTT